MTAPFRLRARAHQRGIEFSGLHACGGHSSGHTDALQPLDVSANREFKSLPCASCTESFANLLLDGMHVGRPSTSTSRPARSKSRCPISSVRPHQVCQLPCLAPLAGHTRSWRRTEEQTTHLVSAAHARLAFVHHFLDDCAASVPMDPDLALEVLHPVAKEANTEMFDDDEDHEPALG